jgi:hypothetical protein
MGKKKIRNRLPFFNEQGTTEFLIDGEWMSLPIPETGELCIPVWLGALPHKRDIVESTKNYYNCVLIEPNPWRSVYIELNKNPMVSFIEMVDQDEVLPSNVYGSEPPKIWDLVNSPARVLYKGKIYIAHFDSWGPIS